MKVSSSKRPATGRHSCGYVLKSPGRPEGSGATGSHFTTDRVRRKLAVPLHPAAGLGAVPPVVWPSASTQQEALGLSPTRVKEINRRLIELGLVTMKDSPNGKRYGRRHEKTGHIIEAYGVDLSPLAACHAEFLRLAEEGRAERAVMGRLRRARDDRQKGHYPDPRDRAGIRF